MSQEPGGGASWSPPGGSAPEQVPEPGGATPPPPPPPGWGGPPQAAAGYGQPGHDQPGAGQPAWGPPPGWGGPGPGAPRPGVVPLRPLGLGELLDGAVSVVRRYPRPTLGLSAVVAVLTTVLQIVLLLLLPDDLTSGASSSEELSDTEIGGVFATALAPAVVSGLASIVLAGIITAVVGKAVLGQPMSTGEAWQQVRPRIWRLLGVALLSGLIVAGGFIIAVGLGAVVAVAAPDAGIAVGVLTLLAAVPLGVYLYVRLSLAAPALVLERTTVLAALRRSGVLIRSAWWRTFGILLLATVVAAFVGQVLQIPFLLGGGPSGLFDEQLTNLEIVLQSIGGGVAAAITTPFTACVTALLYIDRRIRAEGLDVKLAASAAQGGA